MNHRRSDIATRGGSRRPDAVAAPVGDRRSAESRARRRLRRRPSQPDRRRSPDGRGARMRSGRGPQPPDAAALYGPRPTARTSIDVTVPRPTARSRPGIDVHRVKRLHPDDWTTLHQIRQPPSLALMAQMIARPGSPGALDAPALHNGTNAPQHRPHVGSRCPSCPVWTRCAWVRAGKPRRLEDCDGEYPDGRANA